MLAREEKIISELFASCEALRNGDQKFREDTRQLVKDVNKYKGATYGYCRRFGFFLISSKSSTEFTEELKGSDSPILALMDI